MNFSIARRNRRSRIDIGQHRRRRATRPALERVEERVVLSGFTPAQIQQAYGLNQIWFDHGTIPGQGQGQTIAIIDPLNDPNIVPDANTFSQRYGLPLFNQGGPNLQVVTPSGAPPSTIPSAAPSATTGMAIETSLDVEWAHAVAPQANILLVEVPVYVYPNGSYDSVPMFSAADWAASRPGVSVVSMSFGGSYAGESSHDSQLTGAVTFVSSVGDNGTFTYPGSSTNVIGVGGTSLTVDGSGNYVGESVWYQSGGGPDPYNPGKSGPDVGFNAVNDSVYDSWDFGAGASGWGMESGTSFAAPAWAGILAIADQGRALTGLPVLTTASTRNLLQSMSAQGADFHTNIPGSNLLGYSGSSVYGAGTPIASRVVAGLTQEVIPGHTSLQILPGVPYTGEVATFQDFTGDVVSGPNASDYGEVIYQGNGQYEVYGTISLGGSGTYSLGVSIERNWLGPATVPTMVAVSSMTPNQLYVEGLYKDILTRPADAGGLAYFSSMLPSDTNWIPGPQSPQPGSNLSAVATAIVRSGEHYNDIVSNLYWTFLHRAADSGGLEYWSGQLAAGATLETVMSNFLGSQEYLNDNGGTGGPSGAGSDYVMALYRSLLGRSFQESDLTPSEVTGWVNYINSIGGVGNQAARIQVAYDFATSAEFRTDAVRAMYGDISQYRPFMSFIPDLLQRYQWDSGPSTAEIDALVNSGADLLSMEVALASGPEFYSVPHA